MCRASASSVSAADVQVAARVDERFHQAGGRICLEAVGMSAMGKHPSGCLARTRWLRRATTTEHTRPACQTAVATEPKSTPSK